MRNIASEPTKPEDMVKPKKTGREQDHDSSKPLHEREVHSRHDLET